MPLIKVTITAIFDFDENDQIPEDKMYERLSKSLMWKEVKIEMGKHKTIGHIYKTLLMIPGSGDWEASPENET